MSESLQLGDRELISLKEAALRVPYTRDYIARLAREGKIVAAQFNRQWYIDAVVLVNFYETAQLEVRARQEYLREMRRQELSSRESLEAIRHRLQIEASERSRKVVMATMQIFVLGLVTGVFVFLSTTHLSFRVGAGQSASLLDWFVWNRVEVTSVSERWFETGPISDETVPMNSLQGILLVPATTSTTTAIDVTKMLSDGTEVKMLEVGTTTGVVQLGDNASTTLRFVRVPNVTSEENR